MNHITAREAIEQFHLLFLDQFGRKVDKHLYALKGGCNLRFFCKSIRYSEDIDLDVRIVGLETLQNNVNQILQSRPFAQILSARGLRVAGYSEPKQTATTQRWKIALSVEAQDVTLNTKIEFSRREFVEDQVRFEAVDPLLIQHYQLHPIFVNRYSVQEAFRQKIRALLLRGQTQARDLFDLFLLIQQGANVDELDEQLKAQLTEARAKAMSLTYENFKGQVWAYLPVDYQTQYDGAAVWEHLVLVVTDVLEVRKS